MNAAQARAQARSIAAQLIRQYLAREMRWVKGGQGKEDEHKTERELERLAQRLDPAGSVR